MATVVKFTLDQGTTFRRVLTFEKTDGITYDLTNCTIRGQVREQFTDASPAKSFVFNINITDGTAEMYLSAIDTAELQPLTYYYDVELVLPKGDVIRCFEGTIKVRPEVTK